ncbi:MAG: NAD(P)-dependent glycerol-3-phosphate dehydrogenase [Gammaproteobacteria bacterium]|nr:NAD(P)-dependent glycerol-3-phosphate dehydrogenase [Gammaproteobacteria bacterium]
MSAKPVVAVLGAGAWGTALSMLLARNGYPVWLWGKNAAQLERISREHVNPVAIPGLELPSTIEPRAVLADVVGASSFLIAVPSHAFRGLLSELQPQLAATASVAWATKGLEPDSGRPLADVADELLGHVAARAVISGPTFAGEIARGLPAALTVAANDVAVADSVAAWLRNDRVRVYTSTDMVGVQLGGAIKNVMAIAAGISDGLGFGANARAALITRGLAELTRLGMALGGKRETFTGLAGAGDLILTCTDNASRNRRVGLGLGQGRKLPEVLTEIGQEAEGVATARELHRLAREHHIEMPISEQVYRVLYENLPPQAAVEALFKREPRSE